MLDLGIFDIDLVLEIVILWLVFDCYYFFCLVGMVLFCKLCKWLNEVYKVLVFFNVRVLIVCIW